MVELLIVIGVLGVLATGLIIVINPIAQIKKAHDARRKSDLALIKSLLEEYYNDHGRYPAVLPSDPLARCGVWPNCYYSSRKTPISTAWIPALVPAYIKALPLDPVNNGTGPWNTGTYSYEYGNVPANGQHYDLFTQLENTNDPARCGLKDYMYVIGTEPPVGWHWCKAFGGAYSDYIYALDQ